MRCIIETEGFGQMVFTLYPEHAPITVENFVKTARSGFYDGLCWCRIVKDYVIQGGSPDNDIMTDSEWHIKGEFAENGVPNPLKHVRGALSMARDDDFDTAGTQFFVVHKDAPKLDGRYAAFGEMDSGFEVLDAASIAIIGAADGPTSIFVATTFGSKYLGAIIVVAYSYMALVPMVQPPVIRLCTTQAERKIKMTYKGRPVSKTTKILFPIAVTVIVGLVAPQAVALIGFLMFGNLIRECGVLNSLSETAQNVLANLITILLGLTIASRMNAAEFLRVETLLILGLGLVAFVMDTVGGVMIAKLMNLFLKEKINPMIGAAGISAFPMSARVVHKMGLAEDKQNFLLMHAAGVNVSGQIASVIAGGLILALVGG